MKQMALLAFLFVGMLMAGAFAVGPDKAVAKQVREEYREQYRNISDHASVKANYENAKMKWEERRAEFQSSNASLSAAAKNASKEYLYNLIDLMVSHILQMQERIANSTHFSEQDKQEMIASLDDDIARLESLREELGSAEDKAAIKAVAVKVRDAWKDAKSQMKMQAGYIVASNLEQLASRFEQHMERLRERVRALNGSGSDAGGMNEAVANAERNMVQARISIESAKQAFRAGNFEEGKRLLVQARQQILNASGEMKLAIRAAERTQARAGSGNASEKAAEPETPGSGNEDSQGGNQPDTAGKNTSGAGKGGSNASGVGGKGKQ